ncbi:hypothetical protein HPB50_018323 [Hyalomma asiaticum]|uniref:Uncharacterized protein n=1 Tax=Hyalomma asiaticum TaxID=266040 RepID=A0ACB7RLH8_HYAAI|nr:hypothetical protein HPB50_018323 [Hyalomma asiaticum]
MQGERSLVAHVGAVSKEGARVLWRAGMDEDWPASHASCHHFQTARCTVGGMAMLDDTGGVHMLGPAILQILSVLSAPGTLIVLDSRLVTLDSTVPLLHASTESALAA